MKNHVEPTLYKTVVRPTGRILPRAKLRIKARNKNITKEPKMILPTCPKGTICQRRVEMYAQHPNKNKRNIVI